MNETRNVLVESARIARGKIKPLNDLDVRTFDAIIFPGGFGVAKNLCNFAFKGDQCSVDPTVSTLIREAISHRKPIGALCISPVILAKILGNVSITIGDEAETVELVEKMGAQHIVAGHGQVVIDDKHKVFSTPCYMLDATISQIAEGAGNIVKAMLKSM